MSPTAKATKKTTTTQPREETLIEGAGVSDVTKSLRVLVRNSRTLAADAGDVLEREIEMAISISERLRDETIAPELLAEARQGRLNSSVRQSAHRLTDLAVDVGGVAVLLAVRFGERIVDEPRRPLLSADDDATEPGALSA